MAVLLMMRLSDPDRERYGGPEWLGFDEDALNDMPAGELEQWETELLAHGLSIVAALSEFDRRQSVRSSRAVLWMALRQAGVTVPYATFDPRVFAAQYRQPGDADPPAQDQGSSSPGPGGDPNPDSPPLAAT